MKDLKDYLERRHIPIEEFPLHVTGLVRPMIKDDSEENKEAQQVLILPQMCEDKITRLTENFGVLGGGKT